MPRKRYTPEEIVSKLRQVEVMTAQGASIAEPIPPDCECSHRTQDAHITAVQPRMNASRQSAYAGADDQGRWIGHLGIVPLYHPSPLYQHASALPLIERKARLAKAS